MQLIKWIMKQRKKKHEMISMYKEVFQSTYASKYVLADLGRHCCIDSSTFDPLSSRNTDFNEGKRAVFLHIMNTLQLNPNEFLENYHVNNEENYSYVS